MTKLVGRDGQVHQVGDEVKDFRGDNQVLSEIYESQQKISFKGRPGLYYPSVIGAKFVEFENTEDSILPDTEVQVSTKFDRATAKEKGYDE